MISIKSISNWLKAEEAAGKRWATYSLAVLKAAGHGAWSGLSSVVGASILDNSKFNLTNGLHSEIDLLIMVAVCAGGLSAYLYVKANPPKA